MSSRTNRGVIAVFLACLSACAEPEEREPDVPHHVMKPLGPPPSAAVARVPATRCGDTSEGFDDWLDAFRERAIGQGISPTVVTRALADVGYDPGVIELDRTQRPQKIPFETFAAAHVTPARVRHGKRLLATHAELLAKIEGRFGVAPEIIVALWGLETDFGAYQGTTRSLDALVTLAYDCRRAERFREELASALRILQRGDLSIDEMVGAWAGELGQTQFLPSSYERFGVDFDEDGRVDLVASTPDALASTASYLAGHGWRAHEGYGPGSPNLTALESWNKSEVYRRTVVLFASKLRPASPGSGGAG